MYRTLTIYLLPWLYLVFTVNYGVSEVELKVVHFDLASPAVLPCYTKADRVTWFFSSRIIITLENKLVELKDTRYAISRTYENEKNLEISGIKKGDAGNYSCYGGINPIAQYHLIVNYKAEIPFTSNFKNGVKELSTVGLWCNATGMPKPKTSWYVLDERGNEHPLGFAGRYFEIRNLTRGCSGTYRCKAANRLNEKPAVVDMSVNAVYPPELDISLDESEDKSEKNVGNFTFDSIDIEYTVYYRIPASKVSTVVLTCHVSANPNATTSWQVGDQIIANYTSSGEIIRQPGEDNYLYYPDIVNGAFQIKIIANGGHNILFDKPYKCESTNRIGRDWCSVKFKKAILV